MTARTMQLILKSLMMTALVLVVSESTLNVTAQEPRLLHRSVTVLTPTGGVDFNPYTSEMSKTIKQKWYAVIPDAARAGQKGKTIVQFEILRDGSTKNFAIAESSGSDTMDQAAIKGIRDSSPLDPLPATFKGHLIQVRMDFLYNLPPEYDQPAKSNSKPPL